ncbi:MAG: DUF3152 domain-containing protein [Actinomycetota bacterium]|nr:DUF3152 domain-containing protein [Actinomycetota bacterium]
MRLHSVGAIMGRLEVVRAVSRRWLAMGLAAGAVLLVMLLLTPGGGGSGATDAALVTGSSAGEGTVGAPTRPALPLTSSTSTTVAIPVTQAPTTTAPPSTTTPPTTTTTEPPEVGSDPCRVSGEHMPTGSTTGVPGDTFGGEGTVWDMRVEVEDGLAIDPDCFADAALDILSDERGWGRTGVLSFRLVDGDDFDFVLILGSPDLVDALCAPINTGGEFSCRNGSVVAINVDRWEHGAAAFGDDLTTYRHYLINHETGHRLGHQHVPCPAAGEPAPVMMQQSKFTEPCLPNGWPLDNEL